MVVPVDSYLVDSPLPTVSTVRVPSRRNPYSDGAMAWCPVPCAANAFTALPATCMSHLDGIHRETNDERKGRCEKSQLRPPQDQALYSLRYAGLGSNNIFARSNQATLAFGISFGGLHVARPARIWRMMCYSTLTRPSTSPETRVKGYVPPRPGSCTTCGASGGSSQGGTLRNADTQLEADEDTDESHGGQCGVCGVCAGWCGIGVCAAGGGVGGRWLGRRTQTIVHTSGLPGSAAPQDERGPDRNVQTDQEPRNERDGRHEVEEGR